MSETKIEPPFFRGDDEPQPWCDYLLPSGDACDRPPAYAVWWKPLPAMDLDTIPVSATCVEHGLHVDRNLVEHMGTHPLADRSPLAGASS